MREITRMTKNSVVILCGFGPIHYTVGFLVDSLRRAGFAPMLCALECANAEAFIDECGATGHIVVPCAPATIGAGEFGLPRRILRRMKAGLRRAVLRAAPARLLKGAVRRDLVRWVARVRPCAVIAVDKGGMALLSALDVASMRVVYYSLELYTRNHMFVRRDHVQRALWMLEQQGAKHINAIIVQDTNRSAELEVDLGVSGLPMFLLPVCERGGIVKQNVRFWHSKFKLPEGTMVAMYFGAVRFERGCLEVAKLADLLPSEWVFVFHGPCNDVFRDALENASALRRVYVSTEIVARERIEELVASADVGMAIYASTDANNILTGRSSEKIALYTKQGLPIIALRRPSYEDVDIFGAGILVDDWCQLPSAVKQLRESYRSYREGSRRAFEEVYNFDRYEDRLSNFFLSCLVQDAKKG